MQVELGDKVFMGERRTAFRVAKHGKVRGERAVGLCSSGDAAKLNQWMRDRRLDAVGDVDEYVPIKCWVQIADLVRDKRRRGWRERWQQTTLF